MIETMNLKTEKEVQKLEILAKKRELENKLNKDPHNNHTPGNNKKVVNRSSVDANDNQSHWVNFIRRKNTVEASDLAIAGWATNLIL